MAVMLCEYSYFFFIHCITLEYLKVNKLQNKTDGMWGRKQKKIDWSNSRESAARKGYIYLKKMSQGIYYLFFR